MPYQAAGAEERQSTDKPLLLQSAVWSSSNKRTVFSEQVPKFASLTARLPAPPVTHQRHALAGGLGSHDCQRLRQAGKAAAGQGGQGGPEAQQGSALCFAHLAHQQPEPAQHLRRMETKAGCNMLGKACSCQVHS